MNRDIKKLWRAIPEVVAKAAARNGRTIDQVQKAIVSRRPATERDPEIWEVDRDHYAWTGIPPETTDIIRRLPESTRSRWRELHARSVMPVHDRPMELLWIKLLASKIFGTCNCVGHWADYVTANPPTIDTPADYEAWAIAAHNAVNRRIGKAELTIDQARADTCLPITNSATGLGDAISGLYAVCGFASATGRKVLYRSHSAGWLARASHPGVTIEPIEWGAVGVDMNDGPSGYSRQIRHAPTRTRAYTENLATAFGIPAFEPRRPAEIDRRHDRQTDRPGCVLLSPFSMYQSREWPAGNWTELTRRIEAAGGTVVATGTSAQRDRLAQAFGRTRATWRFGCGPDEITSLVLSSACVVANDSGMAHLAGLLGVPTLCVHAGSLPHDFLFDQAPTVASVTLGRQLARSDNAHQTLSRVTVDQVADGVLDRIAAYPASRALCRFKMDNLVAWLISLPVAGDVAELGVYRGGTAAAMAMAAPGRTVHAFDTFAGMPADVTNPQDVHQAGDFSDTEGVLDYLAKFPNIVPHVGTFPATAVDGTFAMVHLDGDQYASTLAGLEWFWPRIVPGGLLVMDDFDWIKCPGVRRAVETYFGSVPAGASVFGHQLAIRKPDQLA